MDSSSINFDSYWKLFWFFFRRWVIYNEDALLMISWSVPCWDILPRIVHKHSLKYKNLEVAFNSFFWSILRKNRSQMFFKVGVLKIFTNFTKKTPALEYLLICWEIWEIFKNTFFSRTPPVAASVFWKDFVSISYESSHTHTRRLYVAATYLFLNYNFILVCGMYFPDWWDTYKLTTSECYRIYSVFYLELKSVTMKNFRRCIN